MRIESQVYKNQTIRIFDEDIEFVNGIADVTDELGGKAISSGLPIYIEGGVPSNKTKSELMLENELSKRVAGYKAETGFLKNEIMGLNLKIQKLNEELVLWKGICEKLKKHIDPTLLGEILNKSAEVEKEGSDTKPGKTEPGKTEPDTETEDNEILKRLKEKKKDELIDMAKQLGISEDQLIVDGKFRTKDDIIELLMSVK